MSSSTKKPDPPPAPTSPEGGTTLLSIESWQGPLPAPETLAEFERIVPGSAEAIIREWGTEANHRRRYEQRALSIQGFEQIGGRVLAFVFAIAALGVTAYLARIGAEWAAGIIGAGTIGSVVLTLVSGRGR